MQPVIVPEKTTYVVTLSFADEAGNAVTPSSGTYRVDDVESGTEIKGTTAFSPSGSPCQLVIAATDNAMHDPARTSERRLVTVTVQYGAGRQITGEHLFIIRNLEYIV